MEKAVNVIYNMSKDDKVVELARQREKALHDQNSMLASAKTEGRLEERKRILEDMELIGIPQNYIIVLKNRLEDEDE